MSKGRSRIVVFTVGIVLCLLLLEVSLRIVGAVYSRLSESDSSRGGAGTTILCLGDSVTFGLGAKRGFSYPDQLQKMLDQSDPQKQYKVINRGWPGQNSAQLLLRVERYLREFRPQIVTLLTGARNQDNYFGFRQFLEKSGDDRRGFLLSLHDSLDTIRLYKFTRLLFRDLTTAGGNREPAVTHELPEIQPGRYPSEVRRGWDEDRPPAEKAVEDCFEGERLKEMGQYDKALEFIQEAVNRVEVQGSCYYLAGSMYLEQKQYQEAIDWFQKGVDQDPLLFGNYDGIGLTLSEQGKMEEAIIWFQKGFVKARYESLYGHCYIGISKAFRKNGDALSAIRFFEQEVKRPSPVDDYLNRLAADYLLLFQKRRSTSDVLRWIQSDIGQLLGLLKRYDVQIIFQNYPYEPDIDAIYQEIGGNSEVVFVDHRKTFDPYTKNGVLSREFFVPDGHPNAKGYHLMAKNLWAVITSTRERN